MIDSFGLKYLQMNKSILKLSGGELVKLNIIAALGKDNDFVFLDEPTNNLDNDSVDCLVKILSSYMSTKIVVVSHDPRLKIINHAIVATQIMDRLHSGNISEDFPTFSVPQIIQGYSNQINPIVSSQYIAEGRYPEDEKKELVASQRIIDQCFLGKTIGDTVIGDNSEWTIVGIQYLDIIITSYNPNDITGYFYKYNPKSYDAFLQSQIEFKKEIDAPITDYYRPDILVLQTNVSQERSLLLDIFTKYPANNYRSYSYDKDISDYNNS